MVLNSIKLISMLNTGGSHRSDQLNVGGFRRVQAISNSEELLAIHSPSVMQSQLCCLSLSSSGSGAGISFRVTLLATIAIGHTLCTVFAWLLGS